MKLYCVSCSPWPESFLKNFIVGLEKDDCGRGGDVVDEGFGLLEVDWESVNQKSLKGLKTKLKLEIRNYLIVQKTDYVSLYEGEAGTT